VVGALLTSTEQGQAPPWGTPLAHAVACCAAAPGTSLDVI